MTIAGVLIDVGKATASFEEAQNASGTIISIEFDAVIEETHDWKNTITTSPVEDGGNIADNILLNPRGLTLSGVVTNAPVFNSDQSTSSSIDNSPQETVVNRVFGLLSNLMDNGNLMIVYTRYKVYSNMAIASINIPRAVGLGEAIKFTIAFTEMRIVSTQNVAVPAGISKKLDKKIGSSVQTKTMPPKTDGAVATPDLNKSQAKTMAQIAPKIVNWAIDYFTAGGHP